MFIRLTVLLVVLTCLGSFKSARAYDVTTYCTVAGIVTIQSMKTGNYIDESKPGEQLAAIPEDSANGRFWKLLAGNGFYLFENVNTSNIFDVTGGCWDGMDKKEVISYKQKEAAPNNKFYISALDNTIGVQCSGALRLKVVEGMIIVENIKNPRTSDDDIRFKIERVS